MSSRRHVRGDEESGTKCELITVEGGRHGMGSWEKAPEMQHWKPEMVPG